MPLKQYRPTTSGRRLASADARLDITKQEPEKSLIVRLQPRSGRNNQGRITVRHRGGGAKRLYRLVDFKQQRYDVPATVQAIEYDPYRSARIALIQYADGVKSYILAPDSLAPGATVSSARGATEAKIGNRMPLEFIPPGIPLHNIELTPGGGGVLARGAGLAAELLGVEGEYAQLKLPSGEIRQVAKACAASLGTLSNPDHRLIRWGKAGRVRHRGIRPTVKGKNMNPVDHPHGGGEGHSPIGQRRGPMTVYGKKARGVLGRRRNKWSNKFIIKPRKG
ncbi:MAG: 50S ribosomal protein L2 [Candidatus Magasanikbacteria bacterium]|nr:50S ribosomal protein L2 [Candidatus Magasanikbacteria bacterium]